MLSLYWYETETFTVINYNNFSNYILVNRLYDNFIVNIKTNDKLIFYDNNTYYLDTITSRRVWKSNKNLYK